MSNKKIKQIKKKDDVFWSYVEQINKLKELQDKESNPLKKKAYAGKIKKLTDKTIKQSSLVEKQFNKHSIIIS